MDRSFALVTGASSGIGKAIAQELARRKVNLVLIALPQTGLPDIAFQFGNKYPIEVKFCELDLTSNGAIQYLYNWCKKQNIRINTLVNNAGIGTLASFDRTDADELETMLKLNNQALVMLSYYFLPDLRRNGPANILNVGSLAAFMTIPGKAVYSASKSFIYSFSLSLRIELRPYKINVSCLCPGGTVTSNRVVKNTNQVRLAGKMMLQMPDEVAKEAVHKMYQGKKLIIPGLHNKFLYMLWKLLPQGVVGMILSAIFFRKMLTPKSIASPTVAFRALTVQ
jgi:hypothetical protein